MKRTGRRLFLQRTQITDDVQFEIDSAQKANTVLDSGADAIVVGDCFHEDHDAYRQTTRVDR